MPTLAQKAPQTKSAASATPHRAHPERIPALSAAHRLQRTIGNQALMRMLQAHARNTKEDAGVKAPVRGDAAVRIQPKLKVNAPGDVHEQEADRVADAVMRMPEPRAQADEAVDTTASPARVQTSAVPAAESGGFAAPPIVHDVLNSPGQPLDATTRAFMEPRFGRDFSGVRVHTDARAAESAAAIDARAYTSGRDVVLGTGGALPAEQAHQLLAHELAHVVQQNGADSAVQRQAAGKPVKNAEAKDSAKNSPSGMVTQSAPGCTFELSCYRKEGEKKIEIKCCFIVRRDKEQPNKFYVSVTPLNLVKGKPLTYEKEVGTAWNRNRCTITYPLGISWESSDRGPDGKRDHIFINYHAFEEALTSSFKPNIAAGGTELSWDFVVLEVYDKDTGTFPLTMVYWMGEPGSAPGKKTATYRVELKKFLEVAGQDYFKKKDAQQGNVAPETLRPAKVREIAGKTTGPIKTSDKGFEESPFVGTIIANNPLEVSDRDVPKKFSKATFDTAAGQTVKGTGGQWVSKFMPVPDSLTAQFQLRGSKVPDELEGTSVAEFKEQAHMLLLWLAENSDLTITIHAHTDASGTPKYNVDLSKKRAASAENYLADKKIWTGINGIPPALAPERVTAIGDGQTRHEEYLKKTNPTNWMKIIGTPDAANTLFRIFEIKYNLTG